MPKIVVEVAGRSVSVSNPGKVFFPRTGHTKLDLVRYYLAVADGALRGVAGRPMALKRFVNGAEAEPFFQKRAPRSRPDWIATAELRFPSGRTADEVVLRDAAGLAWVANLGCIDLNPHPVLASDLDHPDELRVDLDPVPGVEWPQIVAVALVARSVLSDFGLTGWAKTSGSRGMHIYARISPSLVVHRRAPGGGGGGARDRAAGPRPGDVEVVEGGAARGLRRLQPERQGPHGRLRLLGPAAAGRAGVDAADLGRGSRVRSRPCSPSTRCRPGSRRSATRGRGWTRPSARSPRCLSWPPADEAAGLPDAPWPPNYEKQAGEAPRVQPSKRRAPDRVGSGDALGGCVRRRPDGRDGWRGRRARPSPTGRRKSTKPLIEIARAETKAEAMEGLERWKARHADVWPLLEARDVLTDSMRGRSSTWTRIRLNLEHVPEDQRPAQEPLEVDYDPGPASSPELPPEIRKHGVIIRHAAVTCAVTSGVIVLAC